MQLVSASVRWLVAGAVMLSCIDAASAGANPPAGRVAARAAAATERPSTVEPAASAETPLTTRTAVNTAEATTQRKARLADRHRARHVALASPAAAQRAALAAHPDEKVVWNGRPHRNMCIHMAGGEAVVRLSAGDAPSDDPHGFEVYANTRYDTTSRPVLAGRAIEIKTPSYPAYTGRICLGIAPKAPAPPSQDSTR